MGNSSSTTVTKDIKTRSKRFVPTDIGGEDEIGDFNKRLEALRKIEMKRIIEEEKLIEEEERLKIIEKENEEFDRLHSEIMIRFKELLSEGYSFKLELSKGEEVDGSVFTGLRFPTDDLGLVHKVKVFTQRPHVYVEPKENQRVIGIHLYYIHSGFKCELGEQNMRVVLRLLIQHERVYWRSEWKAIEK